MEVRFDVVVVQYHISIGNEVQIVHKTKICEQQHEHEHDLCMNRVYW
jgi:hypothetical protein